MKFLGNPHSENNGILKPFNSWNYCLQTLRAGGHWWKMSLLRRTASLSEMTSLSHVFVTLTFVLFPWMALLQLFEPSATEALQLAKGRTHWCCHTGRGKFAEGHHCAKQNRCRSLHVPILWRRRFRHRQGTSQQPALCSLNLVATDAPSNHLYEVPKETLPNQSSFTGFGSGASGHALWGSVGKTQNVGDPLQWGEALQSFNSHSHAGGQGDDWGAFFTGHAEVRFTSHQMTLRILRRQIIDGSMTQGKAQRLLNSMETMSTWGRRADFIEFLVAFSAVYRSEVTKKRWRWETFGWSVAPSDTRWWGGMAVQLFAACSPRERSWCS